MRQTAGDAEARWLPAPPAGSPGAQMASGFRSRTANGLRPQGGNIFKHPRYASGPNNGASRHWVPFERHAPQSSYMPIPVPEKTPYRIIAVAMTKTTLWTKALRAARWNVKAARFASSR